jgi:hypothetical protein
MIFSRKRAPRLGQGKAGIRALRSGVVQSPSRFSFLIEHDLPAQTRSAFAREKQFATFSGS